MIVTCESCQAKYKLDDSKITGRGAKITCPKCKHVFVVYTSTAEPPSSPTPAPPPPPKPPPAPAANLASAPASDAPAGDDQWDDEPTRIGMVSVPKATPRALPAVGASERTANPTLSLPIPDGDHNVAFLPPPPAATVSPGEAAARAATLDFKKVGVAAWKVKVKIGIVYDFSDIKTLRKYIQDGRVTPADVISYDGRSWKPIGEIPDLDVFFVETWERLNRARLDAPPPPPPGPAVTVEPPPPGPTTDEVRAAPEPTPFRDPFEESKSRQRERAAQRRNNTLPPRPTKGTSRGPMIAALLVLLVAVAGAGWAYQSGLVGGGGASTSGTRAATTAPSAKKDEAYRQKIEDGLKDSLQPKVDVKATPTEVSTLPPDPRLLTPVVPEGAGTLPPGVPAGAVPVRPTTGTTGSSTTSAAKATVAKSSGQPLDTQNATATDHEVIGDGSARSGDWSGAARAYKNAVELDPSNGRLLKKLGDALYRSGDADGAMAVLKRAADAGQRDAYRTLGNIAREQGDSAAAMNYYQQYLASNPKDAGDIERIMKELSGA